MPVRAGLSLLRCAACFIFDRSIFNDAVLQGDVEIWGCRLETPLI
jgi:hypothetical protein